MTKPKPESPKLTFAKMYGCLLCGRQSTNPGDLCSPLEERY